METARAARQRKNEYEECVNGSHSLQINSLNIEKKICLEWQSLNFRSILRIALAL